MDVTVADVLLHGRDAHPAFDRRWTPDGPVLRFLSRYQQEMLSRLAQIKRDAMQTAWDIEIPAEDAWEDGEFVPDRILLHGGTVVFTDTSRPAEELDLLEFSQRFEDRSWGVYFLGGMLRFSGLHSDWTEVDHVTLYYFPQGDDLTAKTDLFVLPGQSLRLLVPAAAAFLAKRAVGLGQDVDAAALVAEQRTAEDLWLDEVTNRRRAIVGSTRSVW